MSSSGSPQATARLQRRVDGHARPGDLVAKDLVQPAAQVAHLATALQRGKRVEERLLDGVLPPPVGGQPARLGLQFALVAPDDGGESGLMAGLDQAHELFVGLGIEQPVAALEQPVRDHHGHLQPPDAAHRRKPSRASPDPPSRAGLARFRRAERYSVGRVIRKTPSTTV